MNLENFPRPDLIKFLDNPCTGPLGHMLIKTGNKIHCQHCNRVLTKDEVAQIRNDNKAFPL